MFTEAIYDNFKDNFSYKDIAKYIYENPDKLYSVPYMVCVELNKYSDIRSIYNINGLDDNALELDFESLKKIIIEMKKINSTYHLLLTGFGEPLKYSKIIELLKYTSENGINIIIETFGMEIDNSFIEKLKSIKKDKIIFVIKLDAYSKEIYDRINLGGNFDKAINSYKILKEAGFKVYRSVVRMNENEEDIEKYVRAKDIGNLIIKKYSTYCGKLIDRKVVDLSPLDRIPCFHLRREIFINNDGSVPLCQYAFDEIIGNIKDDGLETIIDRLKDKYRENALKQYSEFCKNCDDYYTFF
jgi:spiro-SPASM protein